MKTVGSRNRKHGHSLMPDDAGNRSPSATYSSWSHAKMRCLNPQDKRYQEYGGRGITMCDAWRGSFLAFLADMGEFPPSMTLERDDVNGHYEPGNCRWATVLDQNRNKRSNVATMEKARALRAEYAGGVRPVALAAAYGMSLPTVYSILHRRSWSDGMEPIKERLKRQPIEAAKSIPKEPAKKGRPALPEDRRTVVTSIRLPPALNAKLRRIGTPRLVEWLKRIKE